ncbi:hypothetical protein FHR83_008662 [Actinoplanes campanulatus]|uniref:Uncharacterized protein n=1 Tax=Actinoplanes campanulatus TaxID=113559 RepID=A0A7W5ARG4_9ACTN|nr:hypothetical protein [Actinoplanes campanulatus]MBB3100935.1 hypothetical protein [Actinoplanes campanulatus]GGN48817.1 hypothetical protein GCM10010109_86250 [Actinoplanes campanulatus]GID41751.1 hypothetical protein Aca09nite_82570 [Actinoplanes campanulatus]
MFPQAVAVDRTAGERAAALLAGSIDPWEIERFLAEVAAGRTAGS